MAKARKKKARKTAKRAVKARKAVRKTKARKPAKRAKKKSGSIIDAVLEMGRLRGRLAGHNTFED